MAHERVRDGHGELVVLVCGELEGEKSPESVVTLFPRRGSQDEEEQPSDERSKMPRLSALGGCLNSIDSTWCRWCENSEGNARARAATPSHSPTYICLMFKLWRCPDARSR